MTTTRTTKDRREITRRAPTKLQEQALDNANEIRRRITKRSKNDRVAMMGDMIMACTLLFTFIMAWRYLAGM